MPDTRLRLLPGDSWTYETTYRFQSDDIELSNVETTEFAVARKGERLVLTAKWKLKSSIVDGETIPAPKGTQPVLMQVALDGEVLGAAPNPDLDRHRIERAIRIERKGQVREPQFFPVPPNVRIGGISHKVELDPRSKDKPLLAVSFQEQVGAKPLKGIGYYELHPVAGIITQGHWTLIDAPIPGGDGTCEMEITIAAKDVKLTRRPG